MAGSKSNAYENLILDNLFGGTAINLASDLYVGLWTAALDDTSTAATAGEVSAGGYARKAVTRNNTNFPAAAGGTISNGAIIDFGTAGADWGTVTHLAVVSSSSGAGTIFYHADLASSKIIQNGDPVTIPVGDLDIVES